MAISNPLPSTTVTALSKPVTPQGAAQPFLDLMSTRRSLYALHPTSPIPTSRICEILTHSLLHVPSSFNTQTTRIILLLGPEHLKLWSLTTSILRARLSPEAFSVTEAKLSRFAAAFGTILFFEDVDVVKSMEEKFPSYADKFEHWAAQSTGMHQYAIWTALEAEGLGANLQHYNPLIDEEVRKEWNVPGNWKLDAQMVIGEPVEGVEAKEKTFMPMEERFRVVGEA